MPTRPADAPRSLADDLRRRSDDALAVLLQARPDLVHPVPADLTALVSRASTSVSTARALDRLDAWALQVVEVVAALPDPTSFDDVVDALVGVERADVDRACALLLDRALLWGSSDELHLVRAAREAVGVWPAGLYAPGLSALSADAVITLVQNAPPEARSVLDHLLWGPPLGSVAAADRAVTVESASTPIEWLLARSLIVPLDATTVVLPREVALALRGGAFLRDPSPAPPQPITPIQRDAGAIDASAGQSAFAAVRRVEDLLEQWSVAPPSQLRSGGLSVRDLAAAARALDCDESAAALLIEVAHAAGLLASDEEEHPVWLPTSAYDLWLTLDVVERWAQLASAWLTLPRVPALIGQRDDRDSRLNALTPDLDRADAPEVRRLTLNSGLAAPAGTALTAEHVRGELAWRRPRRTSRVRDIMIDSTLHEAEMLGVTGLGALSGPGRALLNTPLSQRGPASTKRGSSSPDAAVAAMAPLLPTPLDHVLLQADLTIVAPGPLESSLAREVGLMADVESTGGATVYRLTADSLRRAFDAGRSAHDVMQFLESRSRTPVPQPLAYLVDDVARKHGVVRVGAAGSYVRCDDEAALSQILVDKRAASLRAVRLAPGVLALQVPVDEALPVLRALGLAPAAEAPDGTVVIRRPDSRRTTGRARSTHRVTEPSAPDALLISAAVKALRAGDRISVGARRAAGPERLGTIPLSSSADTIAAVRSAIVDQLSLWIGYADTDGRATERVVDPIEISRGFLTAYDHRYEEVRSFALARITGVAAHEATPS